MRWRRGRSCREDKLTMLRRIRRWLNPKKPITCLRCGWSAPLIGTRHEQADLAWIHWTTQHEEN